MEGDGSGEKSEFYLSTLKSHEFNSHRCRKRSWRSSTPTTEHNSSSGRRVISKIGEKIRKLKKNRFFRGSVGTDAYNQYVHQFEQWEREVEARKAQVRDFPRKMTKNRISLAPKSSFSPDFPQFFIKKTFKIFQQMKHRKVIDKEAEAAAAYAQSQQAYMSHHLKAMEQQEMQQRAAAAAAVAAVQQQQMMQNMMMRQTGWK